MRSRVLGGALAALAVVAVLAGCSASDGIAGDYGSGSGSSSSDGVYLELGPDEREGPISFSGPTVDGDTLSSDDLLGTVTVVNFWYAGCPPCRIEAPDLAALSAELAGEVDFVGVNVYDEADVARVFEEENGIEYPSILDARTSAVQLAFSGQVAPNAVPTTLILDTEGRVAARISGLIQDPDILREMIETVQERG